MAPHKQKNKSQKSTNKPSLSKGASSSNPDRVVGAKAKRSGGTTRDKATIKRLEMYRSGKVKRNIKGQVVGGELASRDTAGGQEITGATGRIAPDRRWFGNTRTIGQNELDKFREDMRTAQNDPFAVVLHRKKVPVSLVRGDAVPDTSEHRRQVKKANARQRRQELLSAEPFEACFTQRAGKTSRRKRPKLPEGLLPNAVDDDDDDPVSSSSLKAFAKRAAEKRDKYDADAERTEFQNDSRSVTAERRRDLDGARPEARHDLFAKGQSRRIWAELYKVLDCSDVVLHVVDARDPKGTTCERVVNYVKQEKTHKHLLFVLNKCDLVPNWAVKKWLAVLAEVAPAVAFKASGGKAFGKAALIDVLRQLAKLHASSKKQISVGIVGYPNVGKSSVVNALRSKRVCKVAPVPGETKVWQYVSLTRRVNLIDSPGVVYDRDDASSDNNNNEADTVLKGVVRAERLPDPLPFATHLLRRANPDHLVNAYGVPFEKAAGKKSLLLLQAEEEDDQDSSSFEATAFEAAAEEFVRALARKMGRLLPGGEPDTRTVAVTLINDWQRGKIPHFVPPPNVEKKGDLSSSSSSAKDDDDLASHSSETAPLTAPECEEAEDAEEEE